VEATHGYTTSLAPPYARKRRPPSLFGRGLFDTLHDPESAGRLHRIAHVPAVQTEKGEFRGRLEDAARDAPGVLHRPRISARYLTFEVRPGCVGNRSRQGQRVVFGTGAGRRSLSAAVLHEDDVEANHL